jgi:hypothetical protein
MGTDSPRGIHFQESDSCFSREFKRKIVRRMLAGENVSALARELKVLRKDITVHSIALTCRPELNAL